MIEPTLFAATWAALTVALAICAVIYGAKAKYDNPLMVGVVVLFFVGIVGVAAFEGINHSRHNAAHPKQEATNDR